MILEIFESFNTCPEVVFNFGGKLADVCKGAGGLTFWEFMSSGCMKFVGAVALAPVVEMLHDALGGWGKSGYQASPVFTPKESAPADVQPFEQPTLAELLADEKLTLGDIVW